MGFFDRIVPTNIPQTMDPAMREMLRRREVQNFYGGLANLGGSIMAAGMAPRAQRGQLLAQGMQNVGQNMRGSDPVEMMQMQGLMARNEALRAETARKQQEAQAWNEFLGGPGAQAAPDLATTGPMLDGPIRDYSPVLGGAPGERQLAGPAPSLMAERAPGPVSLMAQLSPEEVGLLRMLGPEAGKRYLAGRIKPPRETERDKLREDLKAQGHSDDQIRDFMVNRDRYQFSTDMFGNRIVFDRYAGAPVGGAERRAEAPQAAQAREAPKGMPTLQRGFEAGTGGSGFFGRLANTISDAVGAGLVAPEAEKASTALDTLKTRTMLQMTEAIPGRPSDLIRQRLEDLAVQPGSIFQGDERALERLTQTRGLITEELSRLDQNLSDPSGYQPSDLAAMRSSRSQLQELDRAYGHIISNWRAGSAQPAGVPQRIQTKEEMDRLPSGAIFVAPDGSLRRKP